MTTILAMSFQQCLSSSVSSIVFINSWYTICIQQSLNLSSMILWVFRLWHTIVHRLVIVWVFPHSSFNPSYDIGIYPILTVISTNCHFAICFVYLPISSGYTMLHFIIMFSENYVFRVYGRQNLNRTLGVTQYSQVPQCQEVHLTRMLSDSVTHNRHSGSDQGILWEVRQDMYFQHYDLNSVWYISVCSHVRFLTHMIIRIAVGETPWPCCRVLSCFTSE